MLAFFCYLTKCLQLTEFVFLQEECAARLLDVTKRYEQEEATVRTLDGQIKTLKKEIDEYKIQVICFLLPFVTIDRNCWKKTESQILIIP